jgi:3',5'-cyclic AMP phosphodiesterase CpdA
MKNILRTKRCLCLLSWVFLLAVFLPPPARAQRPTFAIVSDSHVGASNSVYPAFVRAIKEAGIDMVIHTGDAIDIPENRRQWRAFLEATSPVSKFYLAPGNHDIRGRTGLSVYLRYFPKPYYSFSEDDTLFVLLNTELPGEEGMIAGEQLDWLKTELERPFRYKLVFLHEPLFPVIPLHGLDRHVPERDRLHSLFVRSGVCLVVSGHDHVYNRIAKDGIAYVISGATGGTLPTLLSNGDPFRYIVVVGKNDGYSFSVKDMEGITRDEFFLKRPTERRRTVE